MWESGRKGVEDVRLSMDRSRVRDGHVCLCSVVFCSVRLLLSPERQTTNRADTSSSFISLIRPGTPLVHLCSLLSLCSRYLRRFASSGPPDKTTRYGHRVKVSSRQSLATWFQASNYPDTVVLYSNRKSRISISLQLQMIHGRGGLIQP